MKNSKFIIFVLALMSALYFSKCKQESQPETDQTVFIGEEVEPVDSIILLEADLFRSFTYQELFDTAVYHIKDYEGLRLNPYRDVDGTWTIGYGHQLINGYWNWKDSITIHQADSLLLEDLHTRVIKVQEEYGYKENKALAVAMFIYNCGSTAFRHSTLKKKIDQQLPIDSEIVKWCHTTIDGKKVKNEKLLERRSFELKIFKNDFSKRI